MTSRRSRRAPTAPAARTAPSRPARTGGHRPRPGAPAPRSRARRTSPRSPEPRGRSRAVTASWAAARRPARGNGHPDRQPGAVLPGGLCLGGDRRTDRATCSGARGPERPRPHAARRPASSRGRTRPRDARVRAGRRSRKPCVRTCRPSWCERSPARIARRQPIVSPVRDARLGPLAVMPARDDRRAGRAQRDIDPAPVSVATEEAAERDRDRTSHPDREGADLESHARSAMADGGCQGDRVEGRQLADPDVPNRAVQPRPRCIASSSGRSSQ